MTRTMRRGIVTTVGALALVAVPTLGLTSLAGAATGGTESTTAEAGGRPARVPLTDEQRACLEGQGITLPARPAEGEQPAAREKPTDEQRAAMKAAAETCGLPAPGPGGPGGPGRGERPRLTDEQRACLEGQGITLPQKPADGEPPVAREKPTDEQRAAMKAAAEACGLPTPGSAGTGGRTA